LNLFKDAHDDLDSRKYYDKSSNHDNYCQYHSAHNVRLQRVEEDVYKITTSIEKFRNNILIMVVNTFIQICIVLLQFAITAKDKFGQ